MISHHLKQLDFKQINELWLVKKSCSVHVTFSCMSHIFSVFTICVSRQVWHVQTSLDSDTERELNGSSKHFSCPPVDHSMHLSLTSWDFLCFWFSVNAHLQAQTKITDDTIKVTFSAVTEDMTRENKTLFECLLWEHWHL